MTSLARGFLATAVVVWVTAARSAEVADKKALTLDGAKKVAVYEGLRRTAPHPTGWCARV